MDFVAVDVETANADLASICQVGIVTFRGGVVADVFRSLVDPRDTFHPVNVSIHGIDESAVRGSPVLSAIAGEIGARLDGQIVAHHGPFDRVSLGRAASACGLDPWPGRWLDTACVVRRAWPEHAREGWSLAACTARLGIAFRAHDAVEDARAAGEVFLAAIGVSGITAADWLERVGRPIGTREASSRITREGDPDGALAGEVVVFTGALSMPRREAADLAAAAGCAVDAGVSKRTTILVVGDQDVRRLAGEVSGKQAKAAKLIGSGQPLRVLRESDFRAVVATA